MTAIGLHDLSLATTHHVLDLADLAEHAGIPAAKYHRGLGQEQMSVPAPDEDIVTLAASAALPVIERHGAEGIRTLLLATESGIDQSKSAGVYVHRLLGLPASVRVVELKQACYGGAAALQAAAGIIARNPAERVLVITTDVARYEMDGPAEPTQGAAAVAMLVSADPALLEIEPTAGVHTADVDDFWRPNDTTTALVDGALSLQAYLAAFVGAWEDFQAQGGVPFAQIDRFLHHQPFTKMARKAQMHLEGHVAREAEANGEELPVGPHDLEASFTYNRVLGNSYTASLFAALASLLDAEEDLAGRRLGLFSYGSGSVGEFFTGVVRPGYEQHLRGEQTRRALEARVPLTIAEYRDLHAAYTDASTERQMPRVTAGPFRFAGVTGRSRQYEATGTPAAAEGD